MRKMISGFAVAIMLMAASAQAQGAVWSATFTPGDVNGYAVGCRNGDDDAECSNPSILSDDEFTVDGVVYTVTEFYQTSGTNRIYFAGIRSAEHAPWIDIADELKIGSTSLDIGYAFLSQGQNRPLTWRLRWSGDPGLDDVLGGDSLTDGTSISVTLISGDLPPPPLTCDEGEEIVGGVCVVVPPPPLTCDEGEEIVDGVCTVTATPVTTPGAPTGLAATANGPSQIDLAWTAPASTGGSAITGYKIEVSPDGSSWSDLVADTGSTDTAYAHMGLDPATTRHYRVSAINAVGTSDASNSDDTTTASTNTAPTGAPTITGTAQVGQTLTASTTGIADADGLTSPTYTYQWIRVDGTGEEDISGENSSTYTLVDADLGTTIKVKVSFTDDASNSETLTSAATAVVIPPPPLTCDEGEEVVDGVCVVVPSPPPPPPPPTCEAGEELVNGVCVAPPPPPPLTCEEGEEVVDGVCVTPPLTVKQERKRSGASAFQFHRRVNPSLNPSLSRCRRSRCSGNCSWRWVWRAQGR